MAALIRSSILKTYWNPEQPPPSTASLRTRFSFFDVFCSCFILYIITCISGLEDWNLIEAFQMRVLYLCAWFGDHKSLIQVSNSWQGTPETVLEQSTAHFNSNSFRSVICTPSATLKCCTSAVLNLTPFWQQLYLIWLQLCDTMSVAEVISKRLEWSIRCDSIDKTLRWVLEFPLLIFRCSTILESRDSFNKNTKILGASENLHKFRWFLENLSCANKNKN